MTFEYTILSIIRSFSMKLSLGSAYILYTRPAGSANSFYAGVKVSVDSLLTYNEVKSIYSEDFNSALSYHGITIGDEELDKYKSYKYYKCSYLFKDDQDPSKEYIRDTYIVWDAIIDESLTTRIDATYSSRLNFKIVTDPSDGSSSWTAKELNEAIKAFISSIHTHIITTSEYGDSENTFVAEVADSNSDIYKERDELEAKLAEAERTIDILNLLRQSAEKTTKDLYTLNVSSTVTQISEKVDEIGEKIDIIEANLK